MAGSRRSSRREANFDRDLLSIEEVVEKVRAEPRRFADSSEIVSKSGMSETRLNALSRKHYHAAPEDLLLRARFETAKALLLEGRNDDASMASAAGFESTKSFRSLFASYHGLTPKAYRDLQSARSFSLQLPPGYPFDYLRRALGRDPQSASESMNGDSYATALSFGGEPLAVRMQIDSSRAEVVLSSATKAAPQVHAMVVGLLGLEQRTEALVDLATRLGLERLVAGCPQLRVHQTHSVYDGLLWTIIGQQINLPFAFALRRRLVMLAGIRMSGDLYAFPSPENVAKLEPKDLLPHQYSRQKADYVISISRLIAEGKLDLEGLRGMSATRVERTLLAVRGLGPWSVNYMMMRSLGFADCVPLGDTGVTSSLWSLFQTKKRPDAKATLRLMAPFSPYRSLATAHLWQWGKANPSN